MTSPYPKNDGLPVEPLLVEPATPPPPPAVETIRNSYDAIDSYVRPESTDLLRFGERPRDLTCECDKCESCGKPSKPHTVLIRDLYAVNAAVIGAMIGVLVTLLSIFFF